MVWYVVPSPGTFRNFVGMTFIVLIIRGGTTGIWWMALGMQGNCDAQETYMINCIPSLTGSECFHMTLMYMKHLFVNLS